MAYDLYESAATPGVFVTVERWTDQAALDAHMQSPHIAAAFAGRTAPSAGTSRSTPSSRSATSPIPDGPPPLGGHERVESS